MIVPLNLEAKSVVKRRFSKKYNANCLFLNNHDIRNARERPTKDNVMMGILVGEQPEDKTFYQLLSASNPILTLYGTSIAMKGSIKPWS